jgi:hypothetical protein
MREPSNGERPVSSGLEYRSRSESLGLFLCRRLLSDHQSAVMLFACFHDDRAESPIYPYGAAIHVCQVESDGKTKIAPKSVTLS